MSRVYTIVVRYHKGAREYVTRITDHQTHTEGVGNHENPAESFRVAERQLKEPVGFITSADPADWDGD